MLLAQAVRRWDPLNPPAALLAGWRAGIEGAGFLHMNAAGASPSPQAVHDAYIQHLDLERDVGGYAAAARRSAAGGRDAHDAVAALLNCEPGEIALHESAQAAWARAFYSLQFEPSDRIVCFESEYAGNAVAFAQACKKSGAALEVLPMRADGIADLEQLRAALARGPARIGGRTLVALTHVQTDSSVVQPAARVGELCRAHGALYLLDACQTIGQLPLDVRSLQCDFASGTGRKWLRGPRGTGFLCAREPAGCIPTGAPGYMCM